MDRLGSNRGVLLENDQRPEQTGFLSLRWRVAALIFLVTLPFLALTIIGGRNTHKHVRQEVARQTGSMADSIADRIQDHLRYAEALLLAVGESISMDPSDIAANEAMLTRIRENLPDHFNNIKAHDASGAYLGSSSKTPSNVGDREYFIAAVQSRGIGLGVPVISRSNGAWTLAIARAVLDQQGIVAGVVSVSLHLERWSQTLMAGDLEEGSVLVVLNHEGTVLCRSLDPQEWIGTSVRGTPMMRAIQIRSGTEEVAGLDRVMRLVSYREVPGTDWIVSVGVPSGIVYGAAAASLRTQLIIGGLITLLALFLAWFVAGRITRPLRQIAADASRLGAGDLTHRSSVRRGDEIGLLASRFNTMADALQQHDATIIHDRERMAVILRSIGDGVIVTDTQGRVTFINPVAQRMTGWDEVQAGGLPLEQVFHVVNEQSGEPMENPVQTVMRMGTVVELSNHAALRPHNKGDDIPIEDSAAPIRDSAGSLLGVVLVFHDITLRVRQQRALETSLQVQRLLLSELDHRVRNNLSSLIALVDLTRANAPEMTQFALSLRGRIGVMASVHSILSHARWTSVPLETILEAVIPPDSRARVTWTGPVVHVPSRQVSAFAMLLYELFSNATRHGSLSVPDGTIAIQWEARPASERADVQSVDLTWLETGGPHTERQPAPKLGTALVQGLARTELQGSIHIDFQPGITRIELRMSLQAEHTPQTRRLQAG